MSLSPIDLEMDDLRKMFDVPDFPLAEITSPDVRPMLATPDSSPSSPIPSTKYPSPTTSVRSDASLGTSRSPSEGSASLVGNPESGPSTPFEDIRTFFDVPSSRGSTPMLVDEQDMLGTGQSGETAPEEAERPQCDTGCVRHPPIGPNLIAYLPIITSRAALIRASLIERRAEREYLISRIDSVLRDLGELSRQLDTMEALKVIRAANRASSS